MTKLIDPGNFSQNLGNLVPLREKRCSFYLLCGIEIYDGAPQVELKLYISPTVNTIVRG